MHAQIRPLIRVAGFAAVLAAATPSLQAAAATDDFANFESYIKLSGYTPWIDGNTAAYQKRFQTRDVGAAGIEDLHLLRDLKNSTVTLDGRALFGAEDYLLHLNVTKEGVGSFDAGYSSFRTFYDGIGGFFPLNDRFFALTPEALATDRGRFWAEFKFALTDRPVFTIRYTNETRTGNKDSTIWADTNLTGLPTTPSNNATRKITPSYIDLDEHHEVLEASVKHTMGNTTAEVRLIGDWVDNLDTRHFTRYPGETTPNPARVHAQTDGLETESFTIMATTETTFNERLSLNTGISYQDLTSTISGSRANAIGVFPTYDFKDLSGGSDVEVFTVNAALGWRPSANWYVQPALRWEKNSIRSVGTYTKVTQSNASTPPVSSIYNEDGRIQEDLVTPDLTVRYTGFSRMVIYGTFSDRINRGDQRRTDQYNTPVPSSSQIWLTDVNQDLAHLTLGANWNTSTSLILRGEVFLKDHENKFIDYENHLGGRYVIGYQFTGVKLTAILKPLPQLSFTTRYIPQVGKMQVTTDATPEFESMDAETHLISETIDWNPTDQFYAQANLNIGFNYISSAYPSSANPNQRNADNNYWMGSLISGYAASKNLDVSLQYTYQEADNFEPALATYSQPYGASYKEQTISVGLKYRLSPTWYGQAKVGYVDSNNDTTGGRTNFRGPLAYVSLEHAL